VLVGLRPVHTRQQIVARNGDFDRYCDNVAVSGNNLLPFSAWERFLRVARIDYLHWAYMRRHVAKRWRLVLTTLVRPAVGENGDDRELRKIIFSVSICQRVADNNKLRLSGTLCRSCSSHQELAASNVTWASDVSDVTWLLSCYHVLWKFYQSSQAPYIAHVCGRDVNN